MSGLLEHISRWLRGRPCSELPAVVTVPSAAVTDEDTEHWGDMRYLDELARAIIDTAHETEKAFATQRLASMLAAPTIDDEAADDLVEWAHDLAGLRAQRHELDSWRDHLDRLGRANRFWLDEKRRLHIDAGYLVGGAS